MSGRVSSARARANAADGRFHAQMWRVLTRAIETNWVFRGTTRSIQALDQLKAREITALFERIP